MMSSNAAVPAYEGILYTVFQQLRQKIEEREADAGTGARQGLVVAFTSANSGEGVSHTIDALLAGLARDGGTRSLLVQSGHLRNLTLAPLNLSGLCRPLRQFGNPSVCELMDEADFGRGQEGANTWDGSWEYRRAALAALRSLFDYVLIDCPALREANDLLSVAPFADGVILVVEANRTRKEQIVQAERAIEFARGRLLGHILNKRSYVVPGWIYRRL